MSACGISKDTMNRPYSVYQTTYGQTENMSQDFFSTNLCVSENINFGTDQTNSNVAESAGVFNLDTGEVTYSQNIFEKMYPASTTKILTAYIILKYANLDDMVTVSEFAVNQATDSSVCGLNEGDIISVRDLLFGLILRSGNDAAIALAEYYSGSVEAFAEVMNQEALALGASKSHFVNPNGLSDDNHYTTVYDMYLIFQAAIEMDMFVGIIGTQSYDAFYQDSNGNTVSKTWNNTNKYISGDKKPPENIIVLGGKTGTTFAAGHCLALYSLNANNERIISIVFKADGTYNLYMLMNQILSGFAN